MIISEAFDVKNYCSALFCSGSTLERVSSFLKKFRRQLTSLGHAGSPCFSELLLAALHSISLGSVYLKSTLTCKNALIIPVVSWVVYTWNLQLTCKNALLIPVVSWVVYTWNLPLTCKNALIISVVFWVVYTWNLRNMSKTSASAFFYQGFQTPRNRWKHEAAGWVLLLFRGVWNPWWNTKHEFLTWWLVKRRIGN